MVGIVLSKVITFFLLPIYTSQLSPVEFGYYDLILSILNFLVPISYFQIWDGMFRFSFDYQDEKEKYKIVSNTYIIFVIGIIAYTMILFFIKGFYKLDFFNLVYLYGISFAINYLYCFISRTFLRNKLFVISGILNTVVASIINIILIIYFNFGVESLFISQIIGMLLQAIIIELNIKSIYEFRKLHFDKDIIKLMLRFSIPLCIATVSYWLLSGFTVLNINNQLGSFGNGIYSVANKFAGLIALIISIFQFAWNELAYSLANDENRSSRYSFAMGTLFKLIVLGSSVLLLLIKWFFPILINNSYKEAELIIPITLLGVAANSIAGFIGTIFSSEKKTNWIFLSTIISSILNVVLSLILTKKYGLLGSSLSLTLSFIILLVIRLIILNVHFKIKIAFKEYIWIILFLFSIVLYYVVEYHYLIITIIIFSIVIVYALRDVLVSMLELIKDRNIGKRGDHNQ